VLRFSFLGLVLRRGDRTSPFFPSLLFLAVRRKRPSSSAEREAASSPSPPFSSANCRKEAQMFRRVLPFLTVREQPGDRDQPGLAFFFVVSARQAAWFSFFFFLPPSVSSCIIGKKNPLFPYLSRLPSSRKDDSFPVFRRAAERKAPLFLSFPFPFSGGKRTRKRFPTPL